MGLETEWAALKLEEATTILPAVLEFSTQATAFPSGDHAGVAIVLAAEA